MWFDRRGSAEERPYLTKMTPPDRWETLADLPADLLGKSGDDRRMILFDCANTAEGSGLAVRALSGKGPSAARWAGLR